MHNRIDVNVGRVVVVERVNRIFRHFFHGKMYQQSVLLLHRMRTIIITETVQTCLIYLCFCFVFVGRGDYAHITVYFFSRQLRGIPIVNVVRVCTFACIYYSYEKSLLDIKNRTRTGNAVEQF